MTHLLGSLMILFSYQVEKQRASQSSGCLLPEKIFDKLVKNRHIVTFELDNASRSDTPTSFV
jgi:hypothetical protein